jgi:rare lipoprotein A (peptidoglycan hydrolase)
MSRFDTVLCLTMILAVVLVFGFQVFRPSHQPDSRLESAIPANATAGPSSFAAEANGKIAGARTGAPGDAIPRVGVGAVAFLPPTSGAPTSTATPATPRRLVTKVAAQSVTAAGSGHSLSGVATWYRYRIAQAAAGPRLRASLGPNWRGHWVRVSNGSRAVLVRLTDWCGCSWARVIDLDYRSFRQLAPLSRGIVSVTVQW